MSNRATTMAAVLSLAALAGCGVSAEDAPRQVTPPRGPYQAVTSPAPPATESGGLAEQLYYVRDDALVAVTRRVRTPSAPQAQIQLLLNGPTGTERNAGLTSALTGASVITGVRVAVGEATVDVAEGLAGSGRNDEVLAFGQIVCTLTSRPDVDRVSFLHEGQRLGVPRADGSLSFGPLTAADYTRMTAPG